MTNMDVRNQLDETVGKLLELQPGNAAIKTLRESLPELSAKNAEIILKILLAHAERSSLTAPAADAAMVERELRKNFLGAEQWTKEGIAEGSSCQPSSLIPNTRLDRERILKTAEFAALQAGELIVGARRGRDFSVRNKKSDVDLVTSADVASEKVILEAIRREFPDHKILAEESAPHLSPEEYRKPLWIIDPIDGTTNFVHGHYQVGVSIAFAVGGTVEVGVVHAPFLKETFSAKRGAGAFMNGAPIKASTTDTLKRSLIGIGCPYTREDTPVFIQRLGALFSECRDTRRLGSAALDLCMVAAGRFEGFYDTVNPWDIAAGRLIAREAGAKAGHIHPRGPDSLLPEDLDGFELLVAAPGIFNELQRLLETAARP
jgi:myo-inositol-1(or 4)-monophosphatase